MVPHRNQLVIYHIFLASFSSDYYGESLANGVVYKVESLIPEGNERIDHLLVLFFALYLGGSFLFSMILGFIVCKVSKNESIIVLCIYCAFFAFCTCLFLKSSLDMSMTSVDFPLLFSEFFFGHLFMMMRRVKKNEKHHN